MYVKKRSCSVLTERNPYGVVLYCPEFPTQAMEVNFMGEGLRSALVR